MGMVKENGAGVIIDFTGYGGQKQAQVDKWLDGQVAERYSGRDAVSNPTLRLMTLYDVLDEEAQSKFYGYVERKAENTMGVQIRREQFWALMTSAHDAWDDMEEYGKRLAVKHKVFKGGK